LKEDEVAWTPQDSGHIATTAPSSLSQSVTPGIAPSPSSVT